MGNPRASGLVGLPASRWHAPCAPLAGSALRAAGVTETRHVTAGPTMAEETRDPAPRGLPAAFRSILLPGGENRRMDGAMTGFVYFNIHDRARLPARFYGMAQSILGRL